MYEATPVPRYHQPAPLLHHVPPTSGRFDLQREIAELQASPQYRLDGHAGRTLVKTLGLRLVLVALERGAALEDHRVHSPVSIQIVAGRVRIEADRRFEVSAGELLFLEPDIVHDAVALEDSVILLSIPRPCGP